MRLVDIVFIAKDEDGNPTAIELNDLDPEMYAMFVPIGEHVTSLFTTDDLQIAASKLPDNSAAMLLLWENLWTANLRQAIQDAGGQLVERVQIDLGADAEDANHLITPEERYRIAMARQ